MAITYSQLIEAPIEKVFELVDDTEKMKLWMKGLEETTYPDGRDPVRRVGTRFQQKIREGNRVQEYQGEVLEYEPPHVLSVRVWSKSFQVVVHYRFSEEGSSTRFDYCCDLTTFNWLARVMTKLFAGVMRRILQKQMQEFRKVAESGEA